jgi:hypothetical protein
MYFKQLKQSLLSKVYGKVVESFVSYNRNIIVNDQNELFVDGVKIEEDFKSLEEAKTYIRNILKSEKLAEEIKRELYEEIDTSKIASIIKKYTNINKVTDTLVESYIDLASSKLFTLDPVVLEMRKLNRLSNAIQNKFDFKLDDGSVIAISEETLERINSLIGGHKDVLEYMRQDKRNFYSVVKQLKD